MAAMSRGCKPRIFLFICCFSFAQAHSFHGQTKIALRLPFCFAAIVWQIIFEGFLPKPHWQTFQLSSLQPSDWRISYILQPFHGFLRADKQREGQIIAFQMTVSKAARDLQGSVLRRPVSANPELNFSPGIFFFCSKAMVL